MDQLVKDFVQMMKSYETMQDALEKEKRQFGNVTLYASEIHTLVYMAEHPDDSFSKIAQGMKITKGALTNIIKKIEGKQLITKYKKENNSKSVYYHMTEEGWLSYNAHTEFHETNNFKLSDELLLLVHENEDIIKQFISMATDNMDAFTKLLKEVS